MIIRFPRAPLVIITCERVSETRHHSAEGVTVVGHDPPALRFFVDYEDDDGRLGLWDGQSYATALVAARDCVTDGAVIRDRTSETWGRA